MQGKTLLQIQKQALVVSGSLVHSEIFNDQQLIVGSSISLSLIILITEL